MKYFGVSHLALMCEVVERMPTVVAYEIDWKNADSTEYRRSWGWR